MHKTGVLALLLAFGQQHVQAAPCTDPVAMATTAVSTTAAAVPTTAAAVPAGSSSPAGEVFQSSARVAGIRPEDILAAAPDTASCANSSFPAEECTTAEQAWPYINAALQKYQFQSLGQTAALLSLMAYESADFEANVNHFPGRIGQGTKAMLMFNNVYEYAMAQPELQSQVLAINGGQPISNLTYDTIDTVSNSTQAQILALVLPIQYTFSSAAWYLADSTGCPKDTATKLTENGYDGFEYYLISCVQVGSTVPQDRIDTWCTWVEALKPAGMSMPDKCTSTSATSSAVATAAPTAAPSAALSAVPSAASAGY